jgi:RNA polymerase sigma-70 factor (ECF subfamily)
MSEAAEQLETLYRQHATDLLRYLRCRTRSSGEAEDLVQETFLQAAKYPERLAAAESQRAWLFGVAHHLLGSMRRTLRRWMRSLPAEVAAPREAEPDERLVRMREAIERLPPLMREVLVMRLRGGLSYSEIGEALNIPAGTVRSRLHRAMEQLRERLETEVEGDERTNAKP